MDYYQKIYEALSGASRAYRNITRELEKHEKNIFRVSTKKHNSLLDKSYDIYALIPRRIEREIQRKVPGYRQRKWDSYRERLKRKKKPDIDEALSGTSRAYKNLARKVEINLAYPPVGVSGLFKLVQRNKKLKDLKKLIPQNFSRKEARSEFPYSIVKSERLRRKVDRLRGK